MILDKNTASKVAEYLLQIKAVKLNVEEPFTWASGIKSPIYCDNRTILSYPVVRTYIRQQLAELTVKAYGKPDIIAGVATGGIAHGALVAQELDMPFAYVRSAAKGHGLQNMIEGVMEKGRTVVLIEDLISTGGSSIQAVNAVKENGNQVKGVVSIMDYGFQKAEDNFKDVCSYYSLCNFDVLIETALEKQFITKENYDSLLKWKATV
ncbi:MAG: orotate phosphoribosyltransferase [Flavobacteriales bacterium]